MRGRLCLECKWREYILLEAPVQQALTIFLCRCLEHIAVESLALLQGLAMLAQHVHFSLLTTTSGYLLVLFEHFAKTE